MTNYELYFTVFHCLLGLLSLLCIVYLLAKSEKLVHLDIAVKV